MQPQFNDVPIRNPGRVDVRVDPSYQPVTEVLDLLVTKFTKIWWRLEAFLERWKMSVREHRIDTDYNPDDETIRKLTHTIAQLIERPPSNHYHNGGGDKRLLSWILGMIGALVVSAIVGGVTIYGEVTALKATVNGMMSEHGARITRLENINERRYREPQ